MSIHRSFRLCSGVMAGVIAVVTLIVFICPQSVMASMPMPAVNLSLLCHSDSVISPYSGTSAGTAGSCFDRHLATVKQFTNTLVDHSKVWSVISLVVLALVGILQRVVPVGAIAKKLVRFKYRYRWYFTHRWTCLQEKILSWFTQHEGYDFASAA